MAAARKTTKKKKSTNTSAKTKRGIKKKSSRMPAKRAVRRATNKTAKKAVKRTKSKKNATHKSLSIDQIAQSLADGIKSMNAPPNMVLPMVLLRQQFKPASDRKIIAALQKLFAEGIVSLQPDGSYTVNGPK